MKRKQILERKKAIAEIIKSASSPRKDHLASFSSFRHYHENGLSVYLESGYGDKLSSPVKKYIQKLLKANMEGPYGSEWPTEEKVKRREMVAPEARYIFVHEDRSTDANQAMISAKPEQTVTHKINVGSIVGFVHYRFLIEEEVPVLYVYELQLESQVQRKGLGKYLMQLIELIAQKNQMGAVMLTVQKANKSAMDFYVNTLRYTASTISPSRVDPLIGVEKSYEILCKTFDGEAEPALEMDPAGDTHTTPRETVDPKVPGDLAGVSATPSTRGRGRARGHGRMTGLARESTVGQSLTISPEVLTGILEGIQGLKQAIAEFVGNGASVSTQSTSVSAQTSTTTALVGTVSQQTAPVSMPTSTVTVPVVPALIQPQSGFDGYFRDFLKMDPPTFSGSIVTEDPHEFLDTLDRMFRILQCSNLRRVDLTAFRFKGVALAWYNQLLRTRPVGAAPMTWEEFCAEFLKRFFPTSRQLELTFEFERLVQTSGMTVSEYEEEFTRLSRYATGHIPDDIMRATRFIMGLSRPLFCALRPHMGIISYARAVENACALEASGVAEEVFDGSRKRARTEGLYNGSFNSKKGSLSRDHRHSWHRDSASRQSSTSVAASDRHTSFTPSCVRRGRVHVGQCARATWACFRCGQQGHVARDCPQEVAWVMRTCYRCGQEGHLARDCSHSFEAILATGTTSQTKGQPRAESSNSRGRGIGDRGRGRG